MNNLYLDRPLQIGSRVRVKISEEELTAWMMSFMEMSHAEARGYALEVLEGPNVVIGLHDLTDENGVSHPCAGVMTRSGVMFPFWQDKLERERR